MAISVETRNAIRDWQTHCTQKREALKAILTRPGLTDAEKRGLDVALYYWDDQLEACKSLLAAKNMGFTYKDEEF